MEARLVAKPEIARVARSPLLLKAQCFSNVLKEDNARIQKYLEDGGDPSAVRIDAVDEAEPEHIELNVVLGVLQARVPEHPFLPPDETEMPADGWRRAGD
jgi:hypothetical protein